MEYKQENLKGQMDHIIESFEKMRRFTGPPEEFWPAFLELAVSLAQARLGLLLVRNGDGDSWKKICTWPVKERSLAQSGNLVQKVEEIANDSLAIRCTWQVNDPVEGNDPDLIVLGLRLEMNEADRDGVVVFLVDRSQEDSLEKIATHLMLVADTPGIYQLGRLHHEALDKVARFSEAPDLMVLLNRENKFMATAMTFCNEVASRYHCNRVSLGWLEKGYVRLQAISHMERFEKKMDIVQSLEAAMEEAFDQDKELIWPPLKENTAVVRDHEIFAQAEGVRFMVSLPIRLDEELVGVLSCERLEEPFSETEVQGLRVFCDQAARRLGDLKENDRWFGARLAAAGRKNLSKFLGVEHTFAKGLGLILCVALAFLLFGRLPYRVEAPFIIKSDDVKYLPAPFEGYIDDVHVEVGDKVDKGGLLLTLDSRELLLEESSAIANQNRYSREAEKARAQNELAEMRIALAMAAEARARLKLVRYRLGHAEVRAPFGGIVVEGDLEELLGAPVRKGDVLFKIARIEKMYAELEINERDIHELSAGATGEMAFVSQPKFKFPIRSQRVDPVAVAKEEGNVFLVRCVFLEEVADWWRPGMSGVAKVNVGKRNVLWIITHRTIDFFRIFLWW